MKRLCGRDPHADSGDKCTGLRRADVCIRSKRVNDRRVDAQNVAKREATSFGAYLGAYLARSVAHLSCAAPRGLLPPAGPLCGCSRRSPTLLSRVIDNSKHGLSMEEVHKDRLREEPIGREEQGNAQEPVYLRMQQVNTCGDFVWWGRKAPGTAGWRLRLHRVTLGAATCSS